MELLSYIIIAVILMIIGVLYNKFKINMGKEEESSHYDIVKKYLLNDSSLANSKKPMLWVHIDYDINARWWSSFNSRNSRCLNQPYLYLMLQTLINRCGQSFNIALIDDKSFEKIIPGWSIDLHKIANPLREHYRKLALARTLNSYGGMLVMLCFHPVNLHLIDVYNTAINTNGCFIGEFVNHTSSSDYSEYYPDSRMMGCVKNCDNMSDYINYLQTLLSHDNTSKMDFVGDINNWWFEKMKENKVGMISGHQLGTKTRSGNAVLLEDLISNSYIEFAEDAVGVYIPSDELLKRTKYQWFARLSHKQVLESETNIGKYLLLSCAL